MEFDSNNCCFVSQFATQILRRLRWLNTLHILSCKIINSATTIRSVAPSRLTVYSGGRVRFKCAQFSSTDQVHKNSFLIIFFISNPKWTFDATKIESQRILFYLNSFFLASNFSTFWTFSFLNFDVVAKLLI